MSGPGYALLHRVAQLVRPAGLASCIPGHALHEKGSQRQEGVGTLASSQERRVAVVPRINRG